MPQPHATTKATVKAVIVVSHFTQACTITGLYGMKLSFPKWKFDFTRFQWTLADIAVLNPILTANLRTVRNFGDCHRMFNKLE